jgi:AmmeMemoRadiSam system protein B
MSQTQKIRGIADKVGFAHKMDQISTVAERIKKHQAKELRKARKDAAINDENSWRVAISPHDDYSYVGHLYPALLENVKTPLVIIFGVAHKAKSMNIENKLVFDSFTHWTGPMGKVRVSSIRESIMSNLPKEMYMMNDSMQAIEHSVEAIVPFLQYHRADVEIVSILVPAMSFERMQEISKALAEAIAKSTEKDELEWGKDYSFVISTDAVHYGDEDWGGKNYAEFGTDSAGYAKAVEHEKKIINECLIDDIKPDKLKKFNQYTVQESDYHEYKWTWCGRYSVPCGLLTAYNLQQYLKDDELWGRLVGYGTSIDGRTHIPVEDIGMGVTAPAKPRHWVGYVSMGFR